MPARQVLRPPCCGAALGVLLLPVLVVWAAAEVPPSEQARESLVTEESEADSCDADGTISADCGSYGANPRTANYVPFRSPNPLYLETIQNSAAHIGNALRRTISADCGSSGANPRILRIINVASISAGLADGSMAQLPVASNMVVPGIQAAMIFAIGHEYGCYMEFGLAMSVLMLLSSDYVKTAVLKESLGWIPVAGNIMKTGLSIAMTRGMGSVAEKLLSCPGSREQLFSQATSGDERKDSNKVGDSMKRLFHSVSDFFVRSNSSSLGSDEASAKEAAQEVWKRVTQLFWAQGQAELLADARSASPEQLMAMVKRYTWNLEVVEAALASLRERFPLDLACLDVDFVADNLWIAMAADGELKAVAAPHLLHCLSQLGRAGRIDVARSAAKLLLESSRGSHAPRVIGGALELLEGALQGEGDLRFSELALEASVDRLLETLLVSHAQGEAAACRVLRAILAQSDADRLSPLASLRQLRQLDRTGPAEGSEICFPALRADMMKLLTLPTLPAGSELPSARRKRQLGTGSGTVALEASLAGLVGQKCAMERLIRSPGYARLRQKGLWRSDMPLVLLLTGPSGTGKTMLARSLAEGLLGKPIKELEAIGRFRTFHMNLFSLVEDQKTFFGPPRGIQGAGDLPELIKQFPDAVVLLDEIEKAHPSFARALLKVFGEHGTIYDPRTGKDYSTSNATFVLTSNLGKDLISRHPLALAKLGGISVDGSRLLQGVDPDPDCSGYEELRQDVSQWLREPHVSGRENFFRESEMRSRLTDILPFVPFSPQEVQEAVRGFLAAEAKVFADSEQFLNVALAWDAAVVSTFAAHYTRRPEEGLRDVNVQLQAQVRELIESAIDTGLVQRFGNLLLKVGRSGKLDLRAVSSFGGSEDAKQLDSEKSDVSGDAGWVTWGFEKLLQNTKAVASRQTDDPPPVLSGSAGSGLGLAGGHVEHEWEFERSWDWNLAWEQLWEMLWEWRIPLMLTAIMAFTAMSVSFLPAAAPMAAGAGAATSFGSVGSVGTGAAATAAAAAPAAAVGAAATAVGSWVLALLQVAGSAGSVAVPVFTVGLAWQNRHYLAALLWAALLIPILSWALPVWRRVCLLPMAPDPRRRKAAKKRSAKTPKSFPATPMSEPAALPAWPAQSPFKTTSFIEFATPERADVASPAAADMATPAAADMASPVPADMASPEETRTEPADAGSPGTEPQKSTGSPGDHGDSLTDLTTGAAECEELLEELDSDSGDLGSDVDDEAARISKDAGATAEEQDEVELKVPGHAGIESAESP